MELHRDQNASSFAITAYEPGEVCINKTPYSHSLLIHPTQPHTAWRPQNLSELEAVDIIQCLDYQPDLILIGTGAQHHHLPPALLAPLYEKKIGVEVMHSSAACKTFALLSSDQRNVLAAVLIR